MPSFLEVCLKLPECFSFTFEFPLNSKVFPAQKLCYCIFKKHVALLSMFLPRTAGKTDWSVNAHRDKQIAKGGDDSRQEAHNQRAIWGDHELSCRPHGHATCQSGVLDMHLSGQTAGRSWLGGFYPAWFWIAMPFTRHVTMSSFPFFWDMLEMATAVRTEEARAR